MFLLCALLIISILICICVILFVISNDVIARIQVTSAINSLIIMFIAIFCYYLDRPEYIDIALLYALLSFGSILAFKRFFDKLL
ncbi:Na+/H+ ion antiporter subunit F [Candidatus Hepatincola sp. Pdp]